MSSLDSVASAILFLLIGIVHAIIINVHQIAETMHSYQLYLISVAVHS